MMISFCPLTHTHTHTHTDLPAQSPTHHVIWWACVLFEEFCKEKTWTSQFFPSQVKALLIVGKFFLMPSLSLSCCN